MYNNMMLFISDVTPLKVLSVVYPKMTHLICVAHAFHRAAEVVMDNCPKVDLLISSMKKVLSKSSV